LSDILSDAEASGSTVAEMPGDLNRQFPGIRIRMIDGQDSIRPHVKIFVNGEQVLRLWNHEMMSTFFRR
jgi:hypothetical protein